MNGQVYSDSLGNAIVIAIFLILVLITYYITYSRSKKERKNLHRREKRGILKGQKIGGTPSTERLTPIECKANCLMAEYYQLQLREEQEKYDKDIAQLEEECERLQDTIAELKKQNNDKKA